MWQENAFPPLIHTSLDAYSSDEIMRGFRSFKGMNDNRSQNFIYQADLDFLDVDCQKPSIQIHLRVYR